MHPIVAVLELGPRSVPIGSYGVMLVLAIALGSTLTLRAAARAGMDPGAVIATLGATLAGGFVGAWALHGLVQWIRLGDFAAAMARPGLVFYGGALGGGAALYFASARLGLVAARLLDRSVVAIALAHATGRIGCFLGGCCYGAAAPAALGVRYSHPLAPATALGVAVHPVQLYEAAGLLALALGFAWRASDSSGRAQAPPGRRFMHYVVLYCAMRLALESLRGDQVRGLLPRLSLSTSQLIAGALLAVCAGLLLRRRPALASP